MMNIKDIRDRAQGVSEGGVSFEEVQYARKILLSADGDIGSALYVVGCCGTKKDAKLVEIYLKPEYVSIYGEIALKVLCRYMKMIDIYRPLVRKLIMEKHAPWPNGRLAAIQLAPDYLHGYKDDEVGCHLTNIILDPDDDDRVAARDSLIRILNIESQLGSPFAIDFKNSDRDTETISKAAEKYFNCRNPD